MVWLLLLSLGGGFLIFGQIFSGEPGIGVLAGVAAVLGGALIAGAMRALGAIVALVLSAVGAFGGWVWEQFHDGASAGASPKTVQTVLGHASAAFTLTVYGHIFDADLDDLAARLEIPVRDGDGISVERLSASRGAHAR